MLGLQAYGVPLSQKEHQVVGTAYIWFLRRWSGRKEERGGGQSNSEKENARCFTL